MTLDDLSYTTEWDVESLKEGNIIRARGIESEEIDTRPLRVNHMRIMINELSKMYYDKKPPTKEQFNKMFEKHQKYMEDEISNVLDDLENSENFFRVEKKEDNNGDIIIKLKKIDAEERIKLIKNIAKKLVEKMTKEQMQTMLEEGIKKNNDLESLKKIDKKLESETPKIRGNKGCYKLSVDGEDIILLQ
jgi:DNA-binding IscR family transcriptional regulator